MNSFTAINKLQSGLEKNCADDLNEVLCNLADGTCDYVELIPLLEQVAEKDMFYNFDDNGAGGFPRASGEPSSYKNWALKAIENIKENQKFEADSSIARELKSLDNERLKIALRRVKDGKFTDEKLIPILEKIAGKDEYSTYSYYSGWKTKRFGDLAKMAIQKIKENIENEK